MFTIYDFRRWFNGHNSCYPHFWYKPLRGISYEKYNQSSFQLLVTFESWAYAMAGKQNKKSNGWGNTEFINLSLDAEQGKDCKQWIKTQGETLPDQLGQVMVDDYKVSCNWDDNNQCFIATFTGKEDQAVNSGKAISSRSDDWYEALAINLFKHIVIFKSGKWTGEGTKNNWG